jgi:hypothetical protein
MLENTVKLKLNKNTLKWFVRNKLTTRPSLISTKAQNNDSTQKIFYLLPG